MIIRQYISCDTCSQIHMLRVGMGQNDRHEHKFSCANCGEPILIAMITDYKNHSAHIECVENSTATGFVKDKVPVINLDPYFLIPKEQQGDASSFFRLQQYKDIIKQSINNHHAIDFGSIDPKFAMARPLRKPDFDDEWRVLQKAWRLEKRKKSKLSSPLIIQASETYYSNDPISDISDWLWRFSYFFCGKEFIVKRENVLKDIQGLRAKNIDDFKKYYFSSRPISERGDRYFEIYKDFFESYSEFSQVYIYIENGLPIPKGVQTTSVNFDKTKMFYGKAYEHFTHLIGLFAYINNILDGRKFDEFIELTLEKYQKLDKSGRAGPFSKNLNFMALCEEYDVQLRNASHHGTFSFIEDEQKIKYKTGKGALGPEVAITYTEYLTKCSKMFLQISTLMTIELIISDSLGLKFV